MHGNLVPGNVIVGPPGVKVTDFGLWALRDHLAARRPDTTPQSVLSYAAPERLSGEPASPAADMYSLGVLFVACLSGIAPGGTAGASPVMDPDDSVAPSLASLWAACLGANPRERPSAAHAAFMSRQILASGQHDDAPAPAGQAAGPGTAMPEPPAAIAAGAQEPDGAARPYDAADVTGVPAPAGGPPSGPLSPGPRHSTRPGAPGRGGGPRPGRGAWPGSHPRGLSRALRGRAGLVTLGVVAGITAAVAMLTQFLSSPSAQTTGASATPSAGAQAGQHAPAGPPASRPAPSAEVTSSVLASTAPPPLQVLDAIRATIRHGVADGQIRQDVGVDLDNLIQPIQAGLTAGNTAQVPQLVAGLRAKLATRLSEGAITQAADRQLSGELTTLLHASAGRGR